MHARLLPTDDGLLLEDLGSTNGSFLNGKRVLRGEARIGDEIGFDTLRFRLIAPGQADAHHEDTATPSGGAAMKTWMIVGGIAVAAALVLLAAFL